MSDVRILCVRPKTLSRPDKAKLRELGIVVIETVDPDQVRLLNTEGPPMDGGDMLMSALAAMKDDYIVCQRFIHKLCALPRKSQP